MTTPKPKLDLFVESPCLVAKKCRTSTPSLRPPKPPTKSSKHVRRQRGYQEHRAIYTNNTPFTNHQLNDSLIHVPAFVAHHEYHPREDSILGHLNVTANSHNEHYQHEGSFSFGLSSSDFNNHQPIADEYCRMYQQFEIISKIGSGYFADVYKVKSLNDGHYYAIKKTSIPFTSNSDRLRKLQEVRNHQSLPPHPNCVRYYDSWEEDGFLYIQTELCKTSLNEIIEASEDHKLPEHIVWSYLMDLLNAVKHLHDHDLLHLDIKPDNIFLSFDGVAKLGDFGLMCNCLDLNSSTNLNLSTSNNPSSASSNTTPPPMYAHQISRIPTPTTRSKSKFTNTTSKSSSNKMIDSVSHEDLDDLLNHPVSMDHDDSGIINRSDESIDSIDEGDSKYLASETMQGKFTKAADIFSLGITIFEVASGLDLPQRGTVYHKLRHNEIEDLYFNGLSTDLIRIIKAMMEEDYTKRPTVDDLLQLDAVRARRCIIP